LITASYDVEPPLEVDDEYWDDGFTQPPGKPSQLSFFICHLQLVEVNIPTPESDILFEL
jgi:hypothetical protein